MSTPLRTVIIPAAGQGTRLSPLTKVVPKELLPVHDRPVLQFALEEAVAVGAARIVIVIHPTKTIIRDYLLRDADHVTLLRNTGKTDHAAALDGIGVSTDIEIIFAIQSDPLGLGHAVLCAESFLLPGPVGVILPDDVIMGLPCLPQMAAAYQAGHMVAAMDVSLADTAKYGIFVPLGSCETRSIPVSGMVEKPAVGSAPSTLAAVGRYILDPSIMGTLARTAAGRGNEIQLTDAIAADAAHLPLTAFRFSGTRYDCGTFGGLTAAGLAQQANRLVKHDFPPTKSRISVVLPGVGQSKVSA